MSWVVAAVVGTAVVGSSVYSADRQRKAQHEAADAQKLAQEQDARETAEAETNAAVAANAKIADDRRRRLSSSLGGSADPLGDSGTATTPPTALAAGAAPPAGVSAGRAASYSASGTALGAGSSVASPTVRTPTVRPGKFADSYA